MAGLDGGFRALGWLASQILRGPGCRGRRSRAGLGARRAIVLDIPPDKLARRHPEVGPDQIRGFQDALERGQVLLEIPPGKRGPTLVAHAPRGGGDGRPWWIWAVKLDESLTANHKAVTVFAKSDRGRDVKLESPRATVLRPWDEERWRGGE